MSDRKTKKEKIKREQKRLAYKKILKEYEDLKRQLELKVAIEKKNTVKSFHIRNLQILRDTCNFLAPYVVCAGITVGSFALLEGGLPFKKDNINRYKNSELTIEAQGEYVSLDEKYIYYGIYSDGVGSSTIIITSPWEEKDGNYIRHIREYDITSNQENIIKSIMSKDYQGLYEQLKDYKEIEETTDYPVSLEDKYTITGSIHFIDKEDKLTFPESTRKNVAITIIEAIIALGLGSIIAYKRDFSYIESLHDDQYDYRFQLDIYKNDLKELEETNEKILALRRGGSNL